MHQEHKIEQNYVPFHDLYPDHPNLQKSGSFVEFFKETAEWQKRNPPNTAPKPSFKYRGVALFQTCLAHPEQYDAKDENGVQVGYLRLRGGAFRVDVPSFGGTSVYEASPKGQGNFDDDERVRYLVEAIDAILTSK